jgi:aminoglycoside/choline kinase family phosphotransferase
VEGGARGEGDAGEALRDEVAALAEATFGAGVARVDAIAPGLGARRFFRVALAPGSTPGSVIARVSLPEDPLLRPRGMPPEPALEPLRGFLARHGLPVPERYASDPDGRIDLLEDLGDETLETAFHRLPHGDVFSLYAEACDWLPRLQALRDDAQQVPAFGRRLDRTLFAYKAEQLVEWGLPWARGRPTRSEEAELVREAFAWIAAECARAPGRLAHRDYKAANLHLRRGAPPGRRLAMIDVQGAFLAPPEYDLVALLRDPHVALPEADVEAHLARIRPALPDAPDPEAFARRFTLLTLSLCSKILGRYLYAARARGDERYLPFLPNVARSLERAALAARAWDARLERLASLLLPLPGGAAGAAEAPACAP